MKSTANTADRQPQRLPELLRFLKIFLPLITLIFTGIIWGHSMMPGDLSADESGFITQFLSGIFGDGVISEHFIRKTAHFCEYMLLGALCTGDLRLWNKKGIMAFLTVSYICLAVAVIDESIQLFTVGRSGSLFDVWLDHAGSFTGCLCTLCTLYILNIFTPNK